MGIWNFQTAFTRGELDPKIQGRIDIQSYYAGVRKAENVLCIPQGGIKRRPGTEYKGQAYGEGRLEKFAFNESIQYLLVFTADRMQVYLDGELQTNLNGSGLDYIDTPFNSEITSFDYIQSADVGIITHPNLAPQQIVRTSSTEWAISPVPLSNIPQFDYNDSLSPTPTDEIQVLTFADQNEGDRYKLGLEDILTDDILFAGDDTTNENSIREALLALPNTGNSGITVSTTTPLTAYEVTFSGDSAKDWDLITGTAVLTKDNNFQVKTTRTQAGVSRAEDVWSNTRGWQVSCTFHEGRLWFGGSQSRPTTIWGSNVNDFFNFNEGKGRDDELVSATLDTDRLNQITSLFSNRALQVFTTGQEFFVPASPITPSNIAVKPQTNMGSLRVRPVTIEGDTLYVQRTGRSVNQFLFLDELQANSSVSATTLAPHLIEDPKKLDVKQGSNQSDANYVYILNGPKGQLTILNTLLSENVQAFTSWKTGRAINDEPSGIISLSVVDDLLYLLVNREIDGQAVYYIEVESLTANTDSSILYENVNSDLLTGLEHLEGETVQCKADGAYLGEFTVTGGQITLPREANDAEVGLSYTPTVQTMPLNLPLQDGPNFASKKKIKRVAVNLFESNGILINNKRLADKTIAQNQFDAPEPQTGVKRIHLLGWSIDASVTVTQTTPFNMTVLSLGLEVAV